MFKKDHKSLAGRTDGSHYINPEHISELKVIFRNTVLKLLFFNS